MNFKQEAHHEVAGRAYRLWESAGRPQGRDLDFWLLAEAEVVRFPGRKAPDDENATQPGRVQTATAPRPGTVLKSRPKSRINPRARRISLQGRPTPR